MARYTVTLGAGHGGFDYGTIGPEGLTEKDVTLSVVRGISRRLARTGAFEVMLTRPGDHYISTVKRAEYIRENKSLCHIEIHVDLTAENAKSAAVWYSADIPDDRAYAAKLSRRLASALETPDCGQRVRFDYCMLFRRLDGFEDYYSLIEALGSSGIRHVFYCECGFKSSAVRRGYAGKLAGAVAEAVTRTICEVFDVHYPRSLLPAGYPLILEDARMKPVYLKEGYFNLRSGPGSTFAAIGVVQGLIYSGYYEQRNGWLRLAADREEYISASAVELFLSPSDYTINVGDDYEIETTNRDGFHFVYSDLQPRAPKLGALAGGTSFYTTYHGGYRRIFYCDRYGFLDPSAFAFL